MAKIAILTGSHLCFNPRAVKEASALANAGHDVTVFGAQPVTAAKAYDQAILRDAAFTFTVVMGAAATGLSGRIARGLDRARRKAARELGRLAGMESRYQLGPAASPLLAYARRTEADLYIAHSEPGMFAAWHLLHDGRRVGVDMEDWFSEDLLPDARAARPIRLLQTVERDLLRRGAFASCPSTVMAEALAAEYRCPRPTVIYNAFPWADRNALDGRTKDRADCTRPSIHWFSQTIGPGRGLEELVAALPLLTRGAEIHLRGQRAAGFEQWIGDRIPPEWRGRLFFHDPVPNAELLSRIAEHDIGFAGEIDYCRSRDLTITNKILTYLLGGLSVVASDTAGQREVATQAADAVSLYPPRDAAALARSINALLETPERLRTAKSAALAAAERTFCWERHEATVIAAVADALDGSRPRA